MHAHLEHPAPAQAAAADLHVVRVLDYAPDQVLQGLFEHVRPRCQLTRRSVLASAGRVRVGRHGGLGRLLGGGRFLGHRLLGSSPRQALGLGRRRARRSLGSGWLSRRLSGGLGSSASASPRPRSAAFWPWPASAFSALSALPACRPCSALASALLGLARLRPWRRRPCPSAWSWRRCRPGLRRGRGERGLLSAFGSATLSVPSAPGRPLNFCQSPVTSRIFRTGSVGWAPT